MQNAYERSSAQLDGLERWSWGKAPRPHEACNAAGRFVLRLVKAYPSAHNMTPWTYCWYLVHVGKSTRKCNRWGPIGSIALLLQLSSSTNKKCHTLCNHAWSAWALSAFTKVLAPTCPLRGRRKSSQKLAKRRAFVLGGGGGEEGGLDRFRKASFKKKKIELHALLVRALRSAGPCCKSTWARSSGARAYVAKGCGEQVHRNALWRKATHGTKKSR